MEATNKNSMDGMSVAVGRIQADTQHILRAVDEMRKDFKSDTQILATRIKDLDDSHGKRLDAVEKFTYRVAGAVTIMAFIIPLAPKIMELLK